MNINDKIKENKGFLDKEMVKQLAEVNPFARLLVRCNLGRFIAQSQDALHYINMVDNSTPLTGDYVRDITLK